MSDFDWKAVVRTVAPGIATALGGPLAGMAVKALGDAIGLDSATEETVAAALKGATPEDLLKVKQAEQEFQVKMRSLDVDLVKIEAGNTDSARKMQSDTHSKVPGLLAGIITVGFFGILVGIMAGTLSTADNSELLILLGALAASWGAVVNFYFGSSVGSQNKDALLARK